MTSTEMMNLEFDETVWKESAENTQVSINKNNMASFHRRAKYPNNCG